MSQFLPKIGLYLQTKYRPSVLISVSDSDSEERDQPPPKKAAESAGKLNNY